MTMEAAAAALRERTRKAQGLPDQIEDPLVLARIAQMFSGGSR